MDIQIRHDKVIRPIDTPHTHTYRRESRGGCNDECVERALVIVEQGAGAWITLWFW